MIGVSGTPEGREGAERGRAASLAAMTARGLGRGVRRGVSGVSGGARKGGGVALGGARRGGSAARVGIGTASERLIEVAPRIPVRDLATLRRQFPGLGPEEIADRLISAAVKGTMTVGAGIGAAAMLPTPPAMPAELVAETLGVAAIEYKLIAELHEVYGLRVPGGARERATAYLWSWTEQRGIDVLKLSTVNVALGSSMKREMRQRLLRRTLRNAPVLTPFMIGAAVGAVMNRRDTRKLAERVRRDLRVAQFPWPELPAAEAGPGPFPVIDAGPDTHGPYAGGPDDDRPGAAGSPPAGR
ncbi:hypothetical protein OG900_10345 [Streptomyces sp. NBC_00433]